MSFFFICDNFLFLAVLVGLLYSRAEGAGHDGVWRTDVTLSEGAISTALPDAIRRTLGQAAASASRPAGRGPSWSWDSAIARFLDAVLRGQWPDGWHPPAAFPPQRVDDDAVLTEG